MTKTVYKFSLHISDAPTSIPVPRGAKVVSVAEQRGVLMAWVELDPFEVEPNPKKLWVYGTGHHMPDRLEHVGTAHMSNGAVWHVYEES